MSQTKPPSSEVFERLGVFYLGAERDSLVTGQPVPVLYDAKDLTTHAVCVGMTGSGKTGLCTCLLEEAALDGIPAIVVDLKGDLTNLMLTFPQLRAVDFAPWIDPAAAARKGLSLDEFARQTAELWQQGLAQWGEDGMRIQRLRDTVEMRLYTPGSSAGLGLSILKSFTAPAAEIIADSDSFRERVSTSVSGLLALLELDADPLRSREHILLSSILEFEWRNGRDCGLAELIHLVHKPPFERVGVLDLETFFPAKDRQALAVTLNNLLASPSFSIWAEGAPLDIQELLWSPAGKPRLSILYLAHLADAERMFFLTLLLNEVLSWVRMQSGTGSLRALLYIDEVFGYLPPTANPPSKKPLLTLLKQARAFGLGVLLATQNPVDLDYKGLSNAGTWLLGRLQTERDKARVIDGLLGVSMQAGSSLDRNKIEEIITGLNSREFYLHNVHHDRPIVFSTRWALSYLCGPLSRDQVHQLTEQLAPEPLAPEPQALPTMPESAAIGEPSAPQSAVRPQAPPEAKEAFAEPAEPLLDVQLSYYPALLGRANLHYVKSSLDWDEWREHSALVTLGATAPPNPWDEARTAPPLNLSAQPLAQASFAAPPPQALLASSYETWAKSLKSYLYQSCAETVLSCKGLKIHSQPGEDARQFAMRVSLAARESRDAKVAKLRDSYAQKKQSLENRIRQAEHRLSREKSEYSQQKLDSAVSVGSVLLDSLFGGKRVSSRKISGARSAAKGMGRASRERGDVARAQKSLQEAQVELLKIQEEYAAKFADLQRELAPESYAIEKISLPPRKSDIEITAVRLVWVPMPTTTASKPA